MPWNPQMKTPNKMKNNAYNLTWMLKNNQKRKIDVISNTHTYINIWYLAKKS